MRQTLGAIHAILRGRLHLGGSLFPDGPMLDLNPAHGKVTWISSHQHSRHGVGRGGDHTVSLGQSDPLGSEPPPTSPAAICSPYRHDPEAIDEALCRYGLWFTQASDDFLDIDRGRVWRVAAGE